MPCRATLCRAMPRAVPALAPLSALEAAASFLQGRALSRVLGTRQPCASLGSGDAAGPWHAAVPESTGGFHRLCQPLRWAGAGSRAALEWSSAVQRDQLGKMLLGDRPFVPLKYRCKCLFIWGSDATST